jgi:hypothetical protein
LHHTFKEEEMPGRFPLGRVVITRRAADALDGPSVHAAIKRHHHGDWGELDEHDRKANERSLSDGARLLSAYRDRHETKFWIITEADRSATTILLPEDY